MSDPSVFWHLLAEFAGISLLSIGGGVPTISEMHRNAVERHEWMTGAQFSEMYAIAQAAPGPTTTMFAALIGWSAAGFAGALVSTFAILAPSSVLTYAVVQAWDRFRDAPWREVVQAGLVPVTVGLMFAAGYLVASGAVHGWGGFALMLGGAALMLFTRLHPVWIIAGGGLAGLIGFA